MTYIPKRGSKAKNLSLLLIITGFVLMLLSAVVPQGVAFQVLAFALVIAAVFLLQRYVLCEYRYIINDRDDGAADFLVYKKQGKNDVKVCHLSLLSVTGVTKYAGTHKKGAARYDYSQNLTDSKYVVSALDGDRKIEVMIECDEAFARLVSERSGGGGGTVFAM